MFVTDHNFPRQVTSIPFPEADLRSLADIDPWLTQKVADWAVLVGLHQHKARKVHGFITNDEHMLNLTRTLPVLLQTELTLLVCAEVGDDPVAATGLLLLHLPEVARRWKPYPALFVVRSPGLRSNELAKRVDDLAKRERTSASALRRRYGLTPEQLAQPLKDWYLPGTE